MRTEQRLTVADGGADCHLHVFCGNRFPLSGDKLYQTLLDFGREGNTIIKLSGPFRSSTQGYPYHDVDPFIEAAIDAFTLDNCVWGSDWPFVRLDVRVDYGPTLNCLGRWLPDTADRNKVLRENPARLFGFR